MDRQRLLLCLSFFSESSQPFAAAAAKESPIIFFGDMCGEENTSRPANVRAVRLGRTARALQSGRKSPCQKVLLFDRRRQRLLLCLSFFSESSQPFAAGRQNLNKQFRRFFTDSSLFLRELLYNGGVYPVRDCGARPRGKETYCHEISQTGTAHCARRMHARKSRRGVGHRRR